MKNKSLFRRVFLSKFFGRIQTKWLVKYLINIIKLIKKATKSIFCGLDRKLLIMVGHLAKQSFMWVFGVFLVLLARR